VVVFIFGRSSFLLPPFLPLLLCFFLILGFGNTSRDLKGLGGWVGRGIGYGFVGGGLKVVGGGRGVCPSSVTCPCCLSQ
jgi:hypothetical protein